MDNVAYIVMYGLPGTDVPAFGLALDPDARPLAMAFSPELMPQFQELAAEFFRTLGERLFQPLFVPHADGRGATVAAPSADEFGFEVIHEGSMLAPLTEEMGVESWLEYAFVAARTAGLDRGVTRAASEFEGLG